MMSSSTVSILINKAIQNLGARVREYQNETDNLLLERKDLKQRVFELESKSKSLEVAYFKKEST